MFTLEREEMSTNGICSHIDAVTEIKRPKERVCEECVKIGAQWVHLRTCQECGATRCCDSSPKLDLREQQASVLALERGDESRPFLMSLREPVKVSGFVGFEPTQHLVRFAGGDGSFRGH